MRGKIYKFRVNCKSPASKFKKGELLKIITINESYVYGIVVDRNQSFYIKKKYFDEFVQHATRDEKIIAKL